MPTLKPIELASEIVTSFVSNNSLPRGELAALIEAVHAAVQKLATGAEAAPVAGETQTPAVAIRKSVTPEYLICLDDGKRFKSLARHLATLGMTPEQYRAKWGLPSTYPMVAPNYSAQRSALAKTFGLGQVRTNPAAAQAGATADEATGPAPVEETGEEIAAAPSASVETDEEAIAFEPANDTAVEMASPEPQDAPKRKTKGKAKSKVEEAPESAPAGAVARKRGRPRKETA